MSFLAGMVVGVVIGQLLLIAIIIKVMQEYDDDDCE